MGVPPEEVEFVEVEVGEYVGILPSDVGKSPSSFVGKLVTGMNVVGSKVPAKVGSMVPAKVGSVVVTPTEVDGVGSKVEPSPRIFAIE